MPGAAEALANLSREGWRHAVCTNKPTGIARDILAELGLNVHIQTVVGGDTGMALKPDPAPLRACLEALGIPAGRALMVGDSCNDVAAAGAAGVAAVFARYGYGMPPDDAAGVAGFVDSLEEVPALARRIVAAGARSHR
jgi:phosphoglycolate phosphatase